MCNRLVAPPIDDREGMDVGVDGTYDKEDNGGRDWFSAADITINIGVAVDLWFFNITLCQKKDRVRLHGVSARSFSTRLYSKLWEPVTKTDFLNNEIGLK